MHIGRIVVVSILAALGGPWVACAGASDLGRQLETLFGQNGIEGIDVHPNKQGVLVEHNAHFGSDSFKQFSLLVRQLSATAGDFPAVSTVPGQTYRYDPKLEVFEAVSENPGPAFVERPTTLGRGVFDVGFSYLFVDFAKLDGDDLDHLKLQRLSHNDCCKGANAPPGSSTGDPSFENDTAEVFFEKFTLQSHVFALTGTYGITNDWDVNLLVPVVYTHFDVRARAHLDDQSGQHTFKKSVSADPVNRTVSRSDDKLGVGDIQLRSKYHFGEWQGLDFAGGASLRLETGNEDNFQGIGDTTLAPFVAVAKELDRFQLHASSGIEINFANSDRSRVRYGAGVSAEVTKGAAFLLDFIGSSNLQSERLTVKVPQFLNAAPNQEVPNGTKTASQDVRTDIIDIVPGFKVALAKNLVGFLEFFVPINHDGLRPDFIPAGGLQATF